MCAPSVSQVRLFCDPVDCSPPGSSVHGVFQAKILEWVAISSSRGSSQPRDQTHGSCDYCIGKWNLYHCGTWEAHHDLSPVTRRDDCGLPGILVLCVQMASCRCHAGWYVPFKSSSPWFFVVAGKKAAQRQVHQTGKYLHRSQLPSVAEVGP